MSEVTISQPLLHGLHVWWNHFQDSSQTFILRWPLSTGVTQCPASLSTPSPQWQHSVLSWMTLINLQSCLPPQVPAVWVHGLSYVFQYSPPGFSKHLINMVKRAVNSLHLLFLPHSCLFPDVHFPFKGLLFSFLLWSKVSDFSFLTSNPKHLGHEYPKFPSFLATHIPPSPTTPETF